MTQPLETLTYTLAPEDALAAERLPRELRGWGKALFYFWIACAGATLVFLPHEWTGDEGGIRFYVVGALLIGLFWLSANLMRDQYRRVQAYRAVPSPIPVKLEIWDDHLHAVLPDRTLSLAYETIAAVRSGPAQLVIDAPPERLIVPARALATPEALATLAREIEERSSAAAS